MGQGRNRQGRGDKRDGGWGDSGSYGGQSGYGASDRAASRGYDNSYQSREQGDQGRGGRGSSFGDRPSFSRDSGTRDAGQPTVAVVKFFNAAKGFGFANVPGGDDAFLGADVLMAHGGTVPDGATIHCHVRQGRKGPEITSVESIDTSTVSRSSRSERSDRTDRPQRPSPSNRRDQVTDERTEVLVLGTYLDDKGFGFFELPNARTEPRSVFAHVRKFEAGGIDFPEVGTSYEVTYGRPVDKPDKLAAVRIVRV